MVLYEMRPHVESPAHHSAYLAELVCSNSFKSDDETTAAGLLKAELALLGSRLLRIARECSVDAGVALAVDREQFSQRVTQTLEAHPSITIKREEFVYTLNHGYEGLIIAAGPLASDRLMESISESVGDALSFYDAAAPIISAESIDYQKAFFASRYNKGKGRDYLNCPLDEQEYEKLCDALLSGKRVVRREFEGGDLFSACQPIEEIVRSGRDALRFGALKPVGIDDPATGRWAYALVQLRTEDVHRQAYNLVGFQTNLTWSEQRRIFSLVPALRHAEFLRYGVMHRNTFIGAPCLCQRDFSLKTNPNLWFAGQITGTEGYSEALASGLYVALNVYARLKGLAPFYLPTVTVSGALFNYATDPATDNYQPMHVNYGIIEPLDFRIKQKRLRYEAYANRSQQAMHRVLAGRSDLGF